MLRAAESNTYRTPTAAGTNLDRQCACVTIAIGLASAIGAPGDDNTPLGTRIPDRPPAAAALADVHRRVGFRVRAGLALRALPPDAGQRQDLHFGHHHGPL